jgi:hypothetical protein
MARDSASVRRTRKRTSDDPIDSFDVPAAVLCAFCGQADCPGCEPAQEQASGVLAIIPWERSGAGVWTRLWATANATTQGAEAFFAVLPDGEIQPAVRFAVCAEVLAVGSMLAGLAPLVVLALPGLALAVVRDPAVRQAVLRWTAIGVPALAVWMVLAHVSHGIALDRGARRQGAAPQRRRAVRFGLYSCGWDLMAGPLGGLWTLFTKGLRAALGIFDLSRRVPALSTTALLGGVYKLPPEAVTRARRIGSFAAVMIALVSGVVVVAVAMLGLLH